MTDIRQLLREATDDIATDHPDPVGRVRREATRRRRTWAAAGTVVVVAVAIVLPLVLISGSPSVSSVSPRPTPVSPRPGAQTWEPDDGEVAAGFGAIWGVQCCGGSTAASWLDKLNPTDGHRVARIALPGPTTQVATGAGRVWTIGATDGGPSAISAVDPATLSVTTMRLPNVKAEPYDIAFADGSAWVTFDLLNQVWRLRPSTSGLSKSVLDVSGSPQDIAVTGNGQLWVDRAGPEGGSLSRIVVSAGSARLGETVKWPGDIYSPYGHAGGALWASFGAHTILALSPANLAGCDACAEADNVIVRGRQIYTAIWTARGLFVSTFGGPMTQGHTNFYSRRDVNEGREAPTSRIVGGGPLAPDGDGVVIGAGSTGLIHWVPAGAGR